MRHVEAVHASVIVGGLPLATAAVGYGHGARLALHMPAEQVICWALLRSLPLTLSLTLWRWPTTPVSAAAWGGTVRVSQLQWLQPFVSMLLAVPLPGKTLDAFTVGFGPAVIAEVFAGRKMPVHTARFPAPERSTP